MLIQTTCMYAHINYMYLCSYKLYVYVLIVRSKSTTDGNSERKLSASAKTEKIIIIIKKILFQQPS